MEFLFKFFEWFKTIIDAVFSFFSSLIDNLLLLIKYIGIALDLCYDAITFLPSWLQAFAFLTITVSVLYMILGRQGGK